MDNWTEEENQQIEMLNGQCVMQALAFLQRAVTEEDLMKCFNVSSHESLNLVQEELKGILDKGVDLGFIVKSGNEYALPSTTYEADGDESNSSDDGDIESIPEPNSDSYPESNSEPRSVEDESDLEEDPSVSRNCYQSVLRDRILPIYASLLASDAKGSGKPQLPLKDELRSILISLLIAIGTFSTAKSEPSSPGGSSDSAPFKFDGHIRDDMLPTFACQLVANDTTTPTKRSISHALLATVTEILRAIGNLGKLREDGADCKSGKSPILSHFPCIPEKRTRPPQSEENDESKCEPRAKMQKLCHRHD